MCGRAGNELFQSRATCAALAAGGVRILPKTEIAFSHEPHILICHASVFIDHGKGNVGMIYATTRIFYENNIS